MRARSRQSSLLAAIAMLAVSIASVSARAQQNGDASAPPADYPPPTHDTADVPRGRVVEVTIDPPLPGEDPWSRVGLHPGDSLDARTVRQALRTALETGTFAEARIAVRPVAGGLALLVEGQRRVRVREIAFRNVQQRPIENVRQDFGITAGEWVTDAAVDEAVERLHDSYLTSGWSQTRIITGWRDTDDPSTRVLIVDVDEGPATRVRGVVLDGVPSDIAESVRSALGLIPGDIADPHIVRRSLEPIVVEVRRGGYLDAVVQPIEFLPVAPARVDVRIRMHAGPRYRIAWTGIDPYPFTALESALRLEEERALDVTTLNVLSGRVREFFVRRGYLDAQVHSAVHADDAEHAQLRFEVRRGIPVMVRGVLFPGAEHVSASTLRGILNDYVQSELPVGEYVLHDTPAHAIADPNRHPTGELSGGPGFLWVEPARVYVQDLYAEAARRMALRYREQGFLDAIVASPQVQRGNDAQGRPIVDVTYAVTEGPQTMLDEVRFENNDSIPSRLLADQIDLTLGVPLSLAAVDTARTALLDYYREQGHLYVRIDVARDRSPDRTRARVRFVIHEGPEVHVGRILVRGNLRTENWVILQRVNFATGDLLRTSAVRDTQRRLGELGIFSGVSISPVDPDVESPTKDMIVQVIEVRAQYLELRAGYSTAEGIRAGFEYGYRNFELFGAVFSASLSAQVAWQPFFFVTSDPTYEENYRSYAPLDQIRRRASLSLLMPAFRGLGPSWRGSIDASTARTIELQFALESWSVGTTITFRPSRHYYATLTPAELQVNSLGFPPRTGGTIHDIISTASETNSPDLERLIRVLLLPEGTTTLVATRLTGGIDFRDNIFNPTRGVFATGTAELVAISRDLTKLSGTDSLPPADTLHLLASVSGYVPLPIWNVVFATSFRAGINVGLDSNRCQYVTYPNRQFFLGGTDSMRGWNPDTMIPQDVVDGVLGRPAAANNACGGQGPIIPSNTTQDVTLFQRGGDVFFNWRNELRIPIGETGFALGGFLELGNLWREIGNVVSEFAVRADAGFGVRYITPIGPVAFDLGFIIAPIARIQEPPVVFNFSIGLF